LGFECEHEIEVELFSGYLRREVGNRFGQELPPLAGDSGERRGHGIPDLRDDPEELQEEATTHHEGQNH
jgi:hypothetical protein